MTTSPTIPESVRAYFPKRARNNIRVHMAWRREDSTTERPETGGTNGWTTVNKPATFEEIYELKQQGFTRVNLVATGVTVPFKDVDIADLLLG